MSKAPTISHHEEQIKRTQSPEKEIKVQEQWELDFQYTQEPTEFSKANLEALIDSIRKEIDEELVQQQKQALARECSAISIANNNSRYREGDKGISEDGIPGPYNSKYDETFKIERIQGPHVTPLSSLPVKSLEPHEPTPEQKLAFARQKVLFKNKGTTEVMFKIRDKILDPVSELAYKGIWTNKKLFGDYGVKGYVSDKYIHKVLGKIDNPDNFEIAKLLCLKNISDAVRYSEVPDLKCLASFIKENPKIVSRAAEVCSEYFFYDHLLAFVQEELAKSNIDHNQLHQKLIGLDALPVMKEEDNRLDKNNKASKIDQHKADDMSAQQPLDICEGKAQEANIASHNYCEGNPKYHKDILGQANSDVEPDMMN